MQRESGCCARTSDENSQQLMFIQKLSVKFCWIEEWCIGVILRHAQVMNTQSSAAHNKLASSICLYDKEM